MEFDEAPALGDDQPTRQRVVRSILVNGPSTAAALADRLDLTPAAVRRHLDQLVDGGRSSRPASRAVYGTRGRGRPAKVFALTDSGRDGVRSRPTTTSRRSALRFLARDRGRRGRGRSSRPPSWRPSREDRYRSVDPGRAAPGGPCRGAGRGADRRRLRRVGARAARRASSSASTTARSRTSPSEFPQLCEAETEVFAGCSARTSSAWPPSPTATASAPRTFPTPPARQPRAAPTAATSPTTVRRSLA